MEGNLHFKIDWASLTVARKFTVFVFFFTSYPSTIPSEGGAYIWRGDLREGFLRYEFGGLYLEGLIF